MPLKAFLQPRFTPAKNVGLGETVALNDLQQFAGTWTWNIDEFQTDFDSLLGSYAGVLVAGNADLNELRINNMILNAGTYEIKVVTQKNTNTGKLQVLYDAVEIGIQDLYAAAIERNYVATFTLTLTQRWTGALKFKCNGKNAASTGYYIPISRIQIKKIDNLGATKISTGTYVGDGTVNRAIPHNLGTTPKLVISMAEGSNWWTLLMTSIWFFLSSTAEENKTVTACNATNFYVGADVNPERAANSNLVNYRWVAIG